MAKLKNSIIAGLLLLLPPLTTCQRRTADFFPLIPGAVKIMEVTERRIAGTDTTSRQEVRVAEVIKGVKNIPDLGKVWVVEVPLGNGKSILNYYQRHGDTIIKFVPDRTGHAERIVYLVQPLTIGQRWFDSPEKREETRVTACEPVTVPAGSFAQCFRVETRSTRVNFHQTIWLASGLGVVKRQKSQTWTRGDTTFALYQEEQLVEYRILKNRK
ncbi:MAG: hypothetical protein ACP5JB_03600 [candidate division WOR-3 bacterium]|jgi:hypothetical protein